MDQSKQDLHTLIIGAKAGDQDCAKQLYEHLVDRIFTYVSSRTSSRDNAVDITQDVLSDLFAGLPRFSYVSDAAFYSFVFTITKRKLAKQYQADSEKSSDTKEDNLKDVIADTKSDPIKQSLSLDVKSALSTLSEIDRDIVVLHHWSRYSFGEIAQLVSLQEATVRVRHHRACKRLEGYLKN